jgi:16S rRNA (adenine1518-N6/adenine1519-N6)-dimethyltransferase
MSRYTYEKQIKDASDMTDEIFDIVDEKDVVIGQEMRSIVHQRGLWHRGVHVLLFTQAGKLLVQQRSKDRVHAPSALDCSVSEHLKAGEDYHAAAVRGLKEEMGIDQNELQPLIKFRMNYGPNDNEISKLYKGKVDPSLVHFDPVEVEKIGYYSLTELEEFLIGKKFVFSYWFEQILQWYLGNPSALELLETYQAV